MVDIFFTLLTFYTLFFTPQSKLNSALMNIFGYTLDKTQSGSNHYMLKLSHSFTVQNFKIQQKSVFENLTTKEIRCVKPVMNFEKFRENPTLDIMEQEEESNLDENNYWELDEKANRAGFKLTNPEENPYSVMTITYSLLGNASGVCTGTLLTLEWVLTAAHCFTGNQAPPYDKVVIFAGGSSIEDIKPPNYSSRWQIRFSKSVITHPLFPSSTKVLYDVALVQVEKRFKQSRTVEPIPVSIKPWKVGIYRTCRFTGFGKVQMNESHPEDETRKTHYLKVTSPCHCPDKKWPDEFAICNEPQEDHGLCIGDSGGGLVCDSEVVAVACGIKTVEDLDYCDPAEANKCGLNNTITVFAQTYPYLDWIKSYIDNASSSNTPGLLAVFVSVVLCTLKTISNENID